jgi:hypothetical protein
MAGNDLTVGVKIEMEDDADVEQEHPVEPPPEEVPATKPRGGKSRKQRKGFITCPGCDESHPAASFEMNQRFEVECKKK